MPPSPPAPERVVQRLDWQVVRRLDGLLQGEYRSLFRGSGMDLANLREYQPGDDIRAIDWNVTARTDVPYVREFHEERELTAWFLLDLCPSVDFGTAADGRLKRTVLIDFVDDARPGADPARQPDRGDRATGRASSARSPWPPGGSRSCAWSTSSSASRCSRGAPATDLRRAAGHRRSR